MPFSRRDLLIAIAGSAALAMPAAASISSDAAQMRSAASDFLSAIGGHPAGAVSFNDGRRINWHWFPERFFSGREGLALKTLSFDQRDAADALLAASTTPEGFAKANAIMRLQERLGRTAGDYWISIYGDPMTRAWGWSLEGHHLSLNYTIVDDQIAAGPIFLGAKPTLVPEWQGIDRAPMRVEEETARALLLSLDDTRKSRALFDPTPPGDTLTGSNVQVQALPNVGLPFSELPASQRALALAVVQQYTSVMPRGIAAETFARVSTASDDQLWFGWSGTPEKNGLYYYRISGPGWFIEHDNSRESAGHIHSVWRDVSNDFGQRLLYG